MDTLKLHVEVGNNKFDGEGPADLIKELYQAFLAKVGQQPQAAAVTQNQAQPDTPVTDAAMDALLKRVFVERDGVVTLQAKPSTDDADADALVLLMYGYKALRPSEYPVTAVRLAQSAKPSGVNVERLDRAMTSKKTLIMKTGLKRSTRYSLNNPGEQYAMSIMQKMFG